MTLQYEYPVRFRIDSVNDSRSFFASKAIIYSTYAIPSGNNYPDSDPQTIHLKLQSNNGKKGDPLIMSIASQLRKWFAWGTRSYNNAPDDFKIQIRFENGAIVLLEKKRPYYYLMGNRLTKKNVMLPLARVVYRSCFEKDALKLTGYLFKMIVLPENVQYVLENRTPYWFFDVGEIDKWGQRHREKIEVRLNTKMIGTNMAAIEISDSMWCPISIDDLDKFVNYYYHGHTRGKKWAYKSPNKIWEMLVGTAPTDAQSHLMLEFLRQNRTDKMVEDRAKELMHSLTIKYPERIKVIKYPHIDASDEERIAEIMVVRGKLMDWIIVEQNYKTNTQKVKTFAYHSEQAFLADNPRFEGTKHYAVKFKGERKGFGLVKGPICIDNIHDNSSVGDQYAARALALLNDKITSELVYTIKKYIPRAILDNRNVESRVPWDDVESIDWSSVL
jgi:hypothetical protein